MHQIPLKPGPKHGVTRSHSKFAEWLRNNPDTTLPPSYKEMSEITGLSIDTIRNYMYNERKRSKRLLEGAYWYHSELEPRATFEDVEGSIIPDTAFSYVLPVVSRTGKIKLNVRLKDGSVKVIYTTTQELEEKYEVQIEAENSRGLSADASAIGNNQNPNRHGKGKDEPSRTVFRNPNGLATGHDG